MFSHYDDADKVWCVLFVVGWWRCTVLVFSLMVMRYDVFRLRWWWCMMFFRMAMMYDACLTLFFKTRRDNVWWFIVSTMMVLIYVTICFLFHANDACFFELMMMLMCDDVRYDDDADCDLWCVCSRDGNVWCTLYVLMMMTMYDVCFVFDDEDDVWCLM